MIKHNIILVECNPLYQILFEIKNNFLFEMKKFGLGPKDLAANVNFFMYVPVGKNGEMDMGPGISKPGDYVDLLATNNVLAIISNCPQINNPVNNFNPTPVQVIVRQTDS